MACQPIFMARKSNACYSHGHKLMKGDFKDKKNFEVKKTPTTFINHNSSSSDQSSQSSQTLGQILG